MRRVLVEGREMFVAGPGGGSPGRDDPHTSYCLERVDVARDLAAFRRLIEGLKADNVLELFGGSGWHSAAIQDLVRPAKHTVLDISEHCVGSIRRSLPHVHARCADSFEAARRGFGFQFDWIHADFNQYTPKRRRDRAYVGVIEGIFASARHIVTLTDSALFGVRRFAHNRDAYAELFGEPVPDSDTYFAAASRYYWREFGWSIQRVITWDSMASMYRMSRTPPGPFSIEKQKAPAKVRILE